MEYKLIIERYHKYYLYHQIFSYHLITEFNYI